MAGRLVTALVITPDGQQPGIFALCTGVGLHTQRIVAGQLYQPLRKLPDHVQISRRLICRAERVQLGSSGQVIGIISAAAFSFMVQDPSGIIA